MARSKKKAATKKKASPFSQLKKAVAKDVASIKANHKDEIATLKKALAATKKKTAADVVKLKKSVASHKRKSAEEIAKLKSQLAVHKKKVASKKKTKKKTAQRK